MPTSHEPSEERANGEPGHRQQGDEADEHDAGRDRVERCEQRGQDDERRGELRDRIGARQRSCRVGDDRDQESHQPAPKLERPIGERVCERAVVRHEGDATSRVTQRGKEMDELSPGAAILAEGRLVEHEERRRASPARWRPRGAASRRRRA